MDPYSHTPGGAGAKQPGMTGQVKEEVITRLGELNFLRGIDEFLHLLRDRLQRHNIRNRQPATRLQHPVHLSPNLGAGHEGVPLLAHEALLGVLVGLPVEPRAEDWGDVAAEEDQEVIEERYDRLLDAGERARRGAAGRRHVGAGSRR